MMYSAALHRDTWKPHDREPVTFEGVDCCIYVDEFGDGEIRVELIPEDEDEGEQWPVNVLRLSAVEQQAILDQLQSSPLR